MIKVPEEYRFFKKGHSLSTTKKVGNNGTFVIPHYRITGYRFIVFVTETADWEHVVVQVVGKKKKNGRPTRYLTHEEMEWIKRLFWLGMDTVLQYFPAEGDETYQSTCEYMVHLWRPVKEDLIIKPEKSKKDE